MSRSVISLRAHLLFMSHRFLQSQTEPKLRRPRLIVPRIPRIAAACCPHIMQSSPGPRQQSSSGPAQSFQEFVFPVPDKSGRAGPAAWACVLTAPHPPPSKLSYFYNWCLAPCDHAPDTTVPLSGACTASLHCSSQHRFVARQCQWERCPSVRWRGPAWAQHQPGWLNSEIRSLYCCSPLVTSLDASEGWETHSETKLILCLPLLLPLLYKHWFFIAVVCWSDRWSVLYIVTFQGLHHHHHGRAAAEVQGRVQHLLRQVPQAAQRPGPGQQEVRSSGE